MFGKVLSELTANFHKDKLQYLQLKNYDIVIGFHVDTAADFDSYSSPTSSLTQRAAGELTVTVLHILV